MEHCTGGSKEIAPRKHHQNRPAKRGQPLGQQDGKTANPGCRMEMGCRGHYHNQGNRGVRRTNRY